MRFAFKVDCMRGRRLQGPRGIVVHLYYIVSDYRSFRVCSLEAPVQSIQQVNMFKSCNYVPKLLLLFMLVLLRAQWCQTQKRDSVVSHSAFVF